MWSPITLSLTEPLTIMGLPLDLVAGPVYRKLDFGLPFFLDLSELWSSLSKTLYLLFLFRGSPTLLDFFGSSYLHITMSM